MGSCEECVQRMYKSPGELDSKLEEDRSSNKNNKINEESLKIVQKKTKQIHSICQTNVESDNFENKLLKEINLLRSNPRDYSNKLNKIKDSCVLLDNKYIYHTKDGYKLTIKEGKGLIDKCISFLKKMKPLNALKLNPDIKITLDNDLINKVNTNEEEILYFLRIKREQLKENCGKVYISLDYFEDPELIVFLALFEAEYKGYKREILLSPNISCFNASFFKIPNRLFTAISSYM